MAGAGDLQSPLVSVTEAMDGDCKSPALGLMSSASAWFTAPCSRGISRNQPQNHAAQSRPGRL